MARLSATPAVPAAPDRGQRERDSRWGRVCSGQRAVRLSLLLILAGMLMGLAACTGLETPADPGYYTEFHYVDLDVAPNGDVQVTETIRYVYQGTFHSGYATIPWGHTDGIVNVQVAEGNQRYRLSSSSTGEPFTYQVREDRLNQRLEVRWFYPPTSRTTRTFTLKYTARHAVRIYPTGDQLWAEAIGTAHASTIYIARVTVHLPTAVPAADLQLASYRARATAEVPAPGTIQWLAGPLKPGEGLEVRVQWPHGQLTASRAAWQEWEERIQAAVGWGTVLSVLFLPVGFAGLFMLWYAQGRDPQVREVATYLPEPPADTTAPGTPVAPSLPPALAGLLLDGKTSRRHIVATIVDLARRGVISITGYGENDYEFKLLWDETRVATLRPYERDVLEALFSPLQALEIGAALVRSDWQTRVSLRDVRQTFESYIRPIFGALARESVQEGLFQEHPGATAGQYFGLGMGLILGTATILLLLFALSPNVLTTLLSHLETCWQVLHVLGDWGFMALTSVVWGAVMTSLAVLGQFVGRYTWYAVLSPWTYSAFLGPVIGLGIVGWYFGSLLVVLPPALALILWSLGLVMCSLFMARVTPRGAEERARWQAFKRYLGQIELFGPLAVAREIFDRYLPYAIAFGIEKTWVNKFITVDTPAPTWFIAPVLATGTAIRPGWPQPDQGAALAPHATLTGVSDSLFQMLNSVSTGLATGAPSAWGTGLRGSDSGHSQGWSGGGLGGFGGGSRGVR